MVALTLRSSSREKKGAKKKKLSRPLPLHMPFARQERDSHLGYYTSYPFSGKKLKKRSNHYHHHYRNYQTCPSRGEIDGSSQASNLSERKKKSENYDGYLHALLKARGMTIQAITLLTSSLKKKRNNLCRYPYQTCPFQVESNGNSQSSTQPAWQKKTTIAISAIVHALLKASEIVMLAFVVSMSITTSHSILYYN